MKNQRNIQSVRNSCNSAIICDPMMTACTQYQNETYAMYMIEIMILLFNKACIKLIKSDSKDIYNVKKDFYYK